jgi:Tfp pilus assembly protein FimT
MRSPRRHNRSGYTILELCAVIAIIVILGAVLVPLLSNSYSNSRQKAAADLIRSRIVEGRAKAMEQGTWYRLAVNSDKTRIRLAPDAGVNGTDFASLQAPEKTSFNAQVVEDKLDHATAELQLDPNDTRTNDSDWNTIMTVGPEGICREQFNTTVVIKEEKFEPLWIQVRSILGSSGIVPAPQNGSKQ